MRIARACSKGASAALSATSDAFFLRRDPIYRVLRFIAVYGLDALAVCYRVLRFITVYGLSELATWVHPDAGR